MGGGGTNASHFNACQRAPDPLRECWMPVEEDLQALSAVLHGEFLSASSIEKHGEPLLTRSDFVKFLGDIDPDTCQLQHPGLRLLTAKRAGRIFDRVFATQQLLPQYRTIGSAKGITFETLRAALHQVALLVGLHFRYIVDDAVDAFAKRDARNAWT